MGIEILYWLVHFMINSSPYYLFPTPKEKKL